MHFSQDSKLPILIAGAGIGGLAAALALLRRGFDVEIYEQAEELREVGAGVQISPNGSRVLANLGVLEEVRATSCETEGKEIRLWSTGQTWKLFDLGAEAVRRFGYSYFTAYRVDLHNALVEGVRSIKPDAIHLASRCIGFEQNKHGVVLHLESGESTRGKALIGADGIHSTIRSQLFGSDRATFADMMAWRAVIPMEKVPQHLRRPVGTNWVGPGGHVIHYPLRRGVAGAAPATSEGVSWDVMRILRGVMHPASLPRGTRIRCGCGGCEGSVATAAPQRGCGGPCFASLPPSGDSVTGTARCAWRGCRQVFGLPDVEVSLRLLPPLPRPWPSALVRVRFRLPLRGSAGFALRPTGLPF